MIRTKIEKKRQITNPRGSPSGREKAAAGFYFDRLSAACLRHHGAMPQEAHFGERAVQT